MKIHKPKASVLSHLKKPSWGGGSLPMDGNQDSKNLPMTGLKTGSSGNKMSKMPSPKSTGNRKL